MANGTITITNLGSFGMDTGTPILNPGEVAIVALGAIKQKPWVVDGEVRPAYVTTVGASFDHRVVDGDVASRFIGGRRVGRSRSPRSARLIARRVSRFDNRYQ